jgi:hypothetical protein
MFSSVVFKIKVDLDREEDDAKKELKKYLQALYEKYPDQKFIGVATDCITFKSYLPVMKGGLVEDLHEISSINISKVSATEAVLWLDSFIFSKPLIRPTAEDLKMRFGPASPTYHLTFDALFSPLRDFKIFLSLVRLHRFLDRHLAPTQIILVWVLGECREGDGFVL